MVRTLATLCAAALALTACGRRNGDTTVTSSSQDDGVAGLEAVVATLVAAHHAEKKELAAALTRDLLPTADTLGAALRDDAPATLRSAALAHWRRLGADDARLARLTAPHPRERLLEVHAATTEALAAYAPGSPAYLEFPSQAQALAQTVLRPGVTFYEVELVEPGFHNGTNLHLLYHDGARWRMLGPLWLWTR